MKVTSEVGNADNWIDKYDYLIDLGKSLPKIDESEKTLENIITGCQSQVWLNAKKKDNNIICISYVWDYLLIIKTLYE